MTDAARSNTHADLDDLYLTLYRATKAYLFAEMLPKGIDRKAVLDARDKMISACDDVADYFARRAEVAQS